MNLWHDIPSGSPESLNVIIEIPKLSRIKYELDKDTGLIKVDRVLYSPMHYPTNYGFSPQTLWDDGDPLDILVMSYEPFVPGCLVRVRPIGVMEMIDDGDSDSKVLGVPEKDPRFKGISNIDDLENHLLEEIQHFFRVYKDLQEKEVEVRSWQNKEEAEKTIAKAISLYKEKYPKETNFGTKQNKSI